MPTLKERRWRSDDGDIYVTASINYIVANYHRNVSLSEAARICGITPPYLSKLVSTRTGAGFRTHLRGLRALHAAHLLSSTTMSIQDAAHATGFSATAVLDREFDKWFRLTPREFRCLTWRDLSTDCHKYDDVL